MCRHYITLYLIKNCCGITACFQQTSHACVKLQKREKHKKSYIVNSKCNSSLLLNLFLVDFIEVGNIAQLV